MSAKLSAKNYKKWFTKLIEDQEVLKILRSKGELPGAYRIQLFRDWHKFAEDVDSFEEFLGIIEKWSSTPGGNKRAGEAFERWIQIHKAKGTKLRKFEFTQDMAIELGFDIDKSKRIPDRFRVISGSMWDFKKFKSGTKLEEKQIKDYVNILNSPSIGTPHRLLYLFSQESAAVENTKLIQDMIEKGKIKLDSGRSINMLFVGGDNKIYRVARIPPIK